MKISKEQFLINKAYNQFLTEVVFWSIENNKVKADKYAERARNILTTLDREVMSKAKSHFILIDDKAYIKNFIEQEAL